MKRSIEGTRQPFKQYPLQREAPPQRSKTTPTDFIRRRQEQRELGSEWKRREMRASNAETATLMSDIESQSHERIARAREYMRRAHPSIDALVIAHTPHMIAEEYCYMGSEKNVPIPRALQSNGLLIVTTHEVTRLPVQHLSAVEVAAELQRLLPFKSRASQSVVVEACIEGAIFDVVKDATSTLEWLSCERRAFIADMRREKTPEEIELMDRGQTELRDYMREEIPKLFYEGITEYELAQKVEALITRNGAYHVSFPAIVAFGENGAIPHHKPGARALKNGEPVLIDCGNIFMDMVCTDMTRNYWFGKKTEPLFGAYTTDYAALLAAQESATKEYRKGVSLKDVDAGVRAKVGAIPHGLGHGIAQRSVHAAPNANQKSTQRFEVGDVVSNEPGIYKQNAYGIRIEDVIAVTPSGPRVFAQSLESRDLIVVDARAHNEDVDGAVQKIPTTLSKERIQKNLDALRQRMLRDGIDVYVVPKTEDGTTKTLERTIGFQGTHGYLVMIRDAHTDEKVDAYFITDGRYADGVKDWDTHGFTDCFITRPQETYNGVVLPEMSVTSLFELLIKRARADGVERGDIVIEPHALAETEQSLTTALKALGDTRFLRHTLVHDSSREEDVASVEDVTSDSNAHFMDTDSEGPAHFTETEDQH